MAVRTILTFIAKPQQMSFGGNDAFALQLTAKWPAREDRLIFICNANHPCRELFAARLQGRAAMETFNEPMTAELRAAMDRHLPQAGLRRFLCELGTDLLRPFRATACIYRFMRLLARHKPDSVLLNIGGNPPEDLGWRMMLAAWLSRVPRIILINQSYPGRATTALRGAALKILRRMTQFFCDVVVVASEDMADVLMRSMGTRVRPTVISYGVDAAPAESLALADKRRNLQLKDSLTIGVVGNTEERKGIHVLVQAMPRVIKEFPAVQLIIIGFPVDPVYTAGIETLIKELHLTDHVKNMGYMKDAGQYFECFDIGVVPSIFAEAFGIVAIEAMRYKKPVVAGANGGLKEVVVDGETGFLTPPGDAGALAEALLKLLRSPTLRGSMGQAGYERFNRLYETSAMLKSYYKLAHAEVD